MQVCFLACADSPCKGTVTWVRDASMVGNARVSLRNHSLCARIRDTLDGPAPGAITIIVSSETGEVFVTVVPSVRQRIREHTFIEFSLLLSI